MSKLTAKTTLAFDGQLIAKAGKQFESKDVPADVLQAWADKGWCSPLRVNRAGGKAALSGSKKTTNDSIRETK